MTKKYISIPNLPTNKVTDVIVDYRLSSESEKTFKDLGINLIKTSKLNSLYDAVDGHPDMQIHHLGDNVFVCEKTLITYYKKLLPDAVILPSASCLTFKYPYDISLNACRIGDYLFHNLKFTDYQILEYYITKGVRLIDVKQGYSKCSVCIINEKTIITSDIKIAEKAIENGINAFVYNSNRIKLKGFNYGFIGGISGLIDKNTLAINGDISKLDDSESLLNFYQNNGITIKTLNSMIPEDIGSILPIKQL